jgi:DNA-binding XRE family transcriptional regulator
MEMKLDIGKTIKRLRMQNDFTQEDLARNIGVTPQAISRWESNIGYPDIEFLEPDPYNTITVPGTSSAVITCGAYNNTDNSLFIDSSWGPTRLPSVSPDLVAPGVRVRGYYPTGEGVMSGTSVAAAITTGACALMLQWGIVERNAISLDTFQIKGYLIRGCERDPNMMYPNFQWGYGKLDLYNSFNLIRQT